MADAENIVQNLSLNSNAQNKNDGKWRRLQSEI